MKPFARSLTLAALLGLATSANADSLVSYFNFNNFSGFSQDVTLIQPTSGNGSLSTSYSNDDIFGTDGTTLNAEVSDPAGNALGLTNLATNNGRYLQLRVNTQSFSGITLSFATEKNTLGANSIQLSYSTNGGTTFTDFGAPYDPSTAFELKSFDFSSFSTLDNNPDVRFRLTLNGGQFGDTVIDNLKVKAVVPAPSSVAVMTLGGILPFGILLRRRGKK